MGGPCELQVYASDPAPAFAAAEAEVRRLEARYSRYRDDSVVSLINRSAGAAAGCEIDDETAGLIDFADTAFEQSEGLFDLSSGALRRAWDFKAQRVPQADALAQALASVGWQRVDWAWPRLFLPQGMELDLGGIVKEYAADRAAETLRRHGVAHGLAELGGDIAIAGPHPDGSPWQVGIRHPRDPGQAIATIPLGHGAIATSGDYERWFEHDGTRYCHILNPLTGWPAQGLASASVVAPQCLLAGVASTIAMLKGEGGEPWLAELGLPHLCVAPSGAVSGSLAG